MKSDLALLLDPPGARSYHRDADDFAPEDASVVAHRDLADSIVPSDVLAALEDDKRSDLAILLHYHRGGSL